MMKKISLLSLIFITFFACRKDIDEITTTGVIDENPITVISDYNPEIKAVTATLFGTVTDESGAAITNASVTLNNNTETLTTTTDDNGLFLFKNTAMNAVGTYVQVNQDGYFSGSHRFFPREGSVNYSSITMLTKLNIGNFLATDGGVITSEENIKIDFPANSIVSADGNTYTGSVDVSARWVDPTADNLMDIMPGNLQGVNQDLEEVVLASYGMMAVELESPSGEPLNLGNDQKASLTFPVPAELMNNAPTEIPLWYFNETHGIWVLEGTATLQGNQYVGEVAHFSFWNCDVPFSYIELSGTVVSDSGIALPNAIIKLTVISTGSTAWAWTDNDGFFTGKVPDNEEFLMTVHQTAYTCEIYTDNIGPFTVDTDLDDITIAGTGLLNVNGTITNCDGEAITNGWVSLTLSDLTYTYYVSDENNIEFTLFNCEEASELTIVAGDLEGLEQGSEVAYTVTYPLDLGSVSACGNQLTEYISITVDGEMTTFPSPFFTSYADSTWMSASLQNHSIYLDMNTITEAGNYSGADFINYVQMILPSDNGDLSLQCAETNCGFNEIVFTTFGDVGEDVIGTFSGTSDFQQNNDVVTLPFTGEFKIIRN